MLPVKNLEERLKKLRGILRQVNADVFITDDAAQIYYFSGILLSGLDLACMVMGKDKTQALIIPSNYSSGTALFERVYYNAYSIDKVVDIYESMDDKLNEVLSNCGDIKTIALGSQALLLNKYMPRIQMKQIRRELSYIMSQKDEWEIEAIKNSIKLCKVAYNELEKSIKAGMSEIDIYNLVSNTFNKKANQPITFIADLISGPRTCEIGGLPTARVLEQGDVIIVDLLPKLNGYYADMTNVYVVGSINDEHKKIYNILVDAMKEGQRLLRPGIRACDVYKVVYDCIARNGYSQCFPHHAGHGFGLTHFEMPFFIRGDETLLKPGMVVTLEPGIYLQGRFGMRIENDYLITDNGCEVLSYDTKLLHEFEGGLTNVY